MTFRHLSIFLTVYKEKSMTLASKKLYMTQPSVTQAIHELEEFYGVRLFDRIGKRIKLNDESHKLMPIAENIIKTFEESKTLMKGIEVYELKLGFSATIGTYLIDDFLKSMEVISKIKVNIIIENTASIEEKILNGSLNFAVVEGKTHSAYIKTEPLASDELGFIISSKRDRTLFKTIEDLNDIDFITREEGSGTKETLDLIFSQKNINVNVVATVNSIEAIKNLVINDFGISVVPKVTIEKEINEGSLQYFKIEELKLNRTFRLIYHKDKIMNKAQNEVINLLKECISHKK